MAQPIGQRRSARRDAIASVLLNADGAMTTEEILAAAAKIVPGLGIATVYRNLKLLQEAGTVKQIVLPDGLTRFETCGKHHHHHFHCRVCDRAFCLDGCALGSVSDKGLPTGFVAEGHEITYHGLCPACSK